MSILKLSIWMVLILALIPTSQGNRYSLYTIITGTFQDLGDFCNRKPETCDHTKKAFYSLKDKALYVGNAISGAFKKDSLETATIDNEKKNQKQADDTSWSRDQGGNDSNQQTSKDNTDKSAQGDKTVYSQNTLKKEDLAADWLPPKTKVGANHNNQGRYIN